MRRFFATHAVGRGRAFGVLCLTTVLGCGASPTGGPDPAPSTFFKGTMVDATDKRIFDDRGGSGSNPGNGRDTTVATGRMTDLRMFANSAGVTSTDSAAADVVRIGDVMYITRPHPDPTRNVTDTALFVNGNLVRPLSYWRSAIEPKTGRVLTYTTAL